jgi:hypothetical protein
LSPISFILAIYAKALFVIFFPITFLFTYQLNQKLRKNIFLIYGSIIIIDIAIVIPNNLDGNFDFEEFIGGYFSFVKINNDPLFLALLIPVIIIMYVLATKGGTTSKYNDVRYSIIINCSIVVGISF